MARGRLLLALACWFLCVAPARSSSSGAGLVHCAPCGIGTWQSQVGCACVWCTNAPIKGGLYTTNGSTSPDSCTWRCSSGYFIVRAGRGHTFCAPALALNQAGAESGAMPPPYGGMLSGGRTKSQLPEGRPYKETFVAKDAIEVELEELRRKARE